MPWRNEWIEAEPMIDATGPNGLVVIYHTYKDNEESNGPRQYWFSTDANVDDNDDELDDGIVFDVRELCFEGQPVDPERPPFLTDDNLPTIKKRNKFRTYEGVDYDSPEYKAASVAWDEWRPKHEEWIKLTLIAAVEAGLIK